MVEKSALERSSTSKQQISPQESPHMTAPEVSHLRQQSAASLPLRPQQILQLQRLVGNTATRHLLRQREQGTPLAITRNAASGPQRHRLQRKWESFTAYDMRVYEKWDTEFKGRQWYRCKNKDNVYEYKFEDDSTDTLYGEWRTRDQWAQEAGDYVPPPDTDDAPAPEQTPNPSAAPAMTLPPDEQGGWQVQTLFNVLGQYGSQGVCNALTAAQLAGFIAPSEGHTGVTSTNLQKVFNLQTLLRSIMADGYDSSFVTLAFSEYFRSQGYDASWFDKLLNQSSLAQEIKQLQDFFEKWEPNTKTTTSLYNETLSGKNTELGVEKIDQTLEDDVLEPSFDMNAPFEGVVAIKAFRGGLEKSHFMAGHEFSVRYDPQNHTFEIFDQNRGVTKQVIQGQEDISDILSEYIWKFYIHIPIEDKDGRADHCKIHFYIRPLKNQSLEKSNENL